MVTGPCSLMNPSQEYSRESSQQTIDAEIKALEVSTGIQALKVRRNSFSPISTLPPEVSLPYSPFCVHHHQIVIRIIILHGSMYPMSAINGVRLHSINPYYGVMSISPPSVRLLR